MSEISFKNSSDYDVMLTEGLKLSGESKDFFMRGRTRDLKNNLPSGFSPKKILDYGCGLGETSHYLCQLFPAAEVVGTDSSENALRYARKQFETVNVSFKNFEEAKKEGPYDLCYTNGVFHHIAPEHQAKAAAEIFQCLPPGGYFSLFENNPWNPGTLMVMKQIPFDRNAKPLSCLKTKNLLHRAGFQCLRTRFLFYFPRALRHLRFLEPIGASIPLGAQYYILAKKP